MSFHYTYPRFDGDGVNRGQMHANLLGDYLAELEAICREAQDRELTEEADEEAWWDAEVSWLDSLEDEDWPDDDQMESDRRDREAALLFEDWLDSEIGYDEDCNGYVGRLSPLPTRFREEANYNHNTASYYERLWREAGY